MLCHISITNKWINTAGRMWNYNAMALFVGTESNVYIAINKDYREPKNWFCKFYNCHKLVRVQTLEHCIVGDMLLFQNGITPPLPFLPQ